MYACDTSSKTLDGLTKVEQDATIEIGKVLNFKCPDGQVYGDQKYYDKLSCESSGLFTASEAEDKSKCRDAVACTDVPEPPGDKNLDKSASTNLVEYDEAVYKCNSGYTTDQGPDWEFKLTCQTGGAFPSSPAWPTCQVGCKSQKGAIGGRNLGGP